MLTERTMPMQTEDKKKILLGFSLKYYKIFNLFLIFTSILIFGIAKWKFKAENESMIGFFIWIILIFNFLFLLDFLFHKTQIFLSIGKIVLSGEITDVYENLKSELGGTIVCIGQHKQDITWAIPNFELKVGDNIEIHYVLFKNNRKGSLIKINKL